MMMSHSNRYRSKFERSTALQLGAMKGKATWYYEPFKIPYIKPEQESKYTPDFVLNNGIIIETKGYFSPSDRKKHLAIKKQFPMLDIRFVFQRALEKLSKKSKTSYGQWCDKNGFLFANKRIPKAWLEEPPALNNIKFFKEIGFNNFNKDIKK